MQTKLVNIDDDIFDFIIEYKLENDGNSPSYQQITDGLGLSSKNVVYRYLRKLENLGKVILPKDTSKGIIVKGGCWFYNYAPNKSLQPTGYQSGLQTHIAGGGSGKRRNSRQPAIG